MNPAPLPPPPARSSARDHHRARITLLQTGTLAAWRHPGRPLAPRTAQANEQANLELGNKAAALLGVPLLALPLVGGRCARTLSRWQRVVAERRTRAVEIASAIIGVAAAMTRRALARGLQAFARERHRRLGVLLVSARMVPAKERGRARHLRRALADWEHANTRHRPLEPAVSRHLRRWRRRSEAAALASWVEAAAATAAAKVTARRALATLTNRERARTWRTWVAMAVATRRTRELSRRVCARWLRLGARSALHRWASEAHQAALARSRSPSPEHIEHWLRTSKLARGFGAWANRQFPANLAAAARHGARRARVMLQRVALDRWRHALWRQGRQEAARVLAAAKAEEAKRAAQTERLEAVAEREAALRSAGSARAADLEQRIAEMRKLHEAREAKVSELLRDNARLRTAQTSGEAYVNRCQAQLVSLVQSSGTGGFGSRPDEANLFYAKFLESRVEELRSQLAIAGATHYTNPAASASAAAAGPQMSPAMADVRAKVFHQEAQAAALAREWETPPWPRDYATPPRHRNTGLGAP